jgi:hypothetical protein
MKKTFTFLLSILFFTAQSQVYYLQGNLQGSQQVPSNASTATGVVIVKYDATTKFLELWGDYQNLTATITASHIHGPAAVGANAAVLFNLNNTGGTTGTLSGSATLTPAQETDLLAGNYYVNTHNATYPGGEIRAQLTTTTFGQTEYLDGRLQGAQQVPPNGSGGSGAVRLLLDKTLNMVYLTGGYSGLTTAATNAHIHRAAASVSGPVIIPLSFTAGTTGTVHGISAIVPSDQAEMLLGNTYVNVHTSTYPGGEIRGQLTMMSQLVYLKGILQASQQVPTNASTAKGTVIVKYNSVTKVLELVGDYQNLTGGSINASHIHGPAAAGANAPVLFNLTNTGGTSGTLTGTATLTAPQEADLLAGNYYVNTHTTTYPGGEIRAQLTTATSGQTYYFTGTLQGTQSVPSNGSAGTGSTTALLDRAALTVYLTANFSGLTTAANNAHIHQGAAGVNGPVVVPLTFTTATSGTVTGSGTVTAAFADIMIMGNTYLNIHTPTVPGGEIRAQLADLVVPVKLTYFNGYKAGNQVALVWESAQEINVSHYEVEQQSDAGIWVSKTSVIATGGNTATRYTYNDLPLPVKNNYAVYRLKMVDRDGKISYSPVIRINYKQANIELVILTNPVKDNELRFVITGSAVDKKADVSVLDVSGRTVAKAAVSSFMNNHLDVASLPAGVYQLVVLMDGNLLKQRFVK